MQILEVSACKITQLSCNEIALIPCSVWNSSIWEVKHLAKNKYLMYAGMTEPAQGKWHFPWDPNTCCVWKQGLRTVPLVAAGILQNKEVSLLIRSGSSKSQNSVSAPEGSGECSTTAGNVIAMQSWHRKGMLPGLAHRILALSLAPRSTVWGWLCFKNNSIIAS